MLETYFDTENLQIVTIKKDEHCFGYRNSIYKGNKAFEENDLGYGSTYFRASLTTKFVSRRYTKLLDICAQIGSFASTLYVIISLIMCLIENLCRLIITQIKDL